MYGIFRLALTIAVVMTHAGFGPIGSLAVKCFFVLSGFLMTMLMDTVYRGRLADFALNRFLRLYPTYWACMAISALILWFFPSIFPLTTGYPSAGTLPWHLLYINVDRSELNLVPTSWAVTNEIVMYGLIALGISKTIGRTVVWLCASALFAISVREFLPGNAGWNYFSIPAASLPFAMGAMAYHLRHIIPPGRAIWVAVAGVLGLAGSVILVHGFNSSLVSTNLAMFSTAFLVIALLLVPAPRRLGHFDDFLGSLSYPMYLIHMPVACIIYNFLPYGRSVPGLIGLVVCSLFFSLGIVILVDQPIQRLRMKVRNRQAPPRDGAVIPGQ